MSASFFSSDNTEPLTGNTPAPSSFYNGGANYAEADPVAAADSASAAAASAAQAAASVQAAAASSAPAMDGTAAVGSAPRWAREDHVHPSDTSRAPANFLQSGSGAVSRTVQNKLSEVVSVLDFGADPTGVADSAPAFRAAMAAAAYGGKVRMPSGTYLLNSYTNNAILDFTPFPNKGIIFEGDGWNHAGGGTPLEGTALLLGGSIPNTVDFYHQAPTGYVFGGTGFKDFGLSTVMLVFGGALGRHGLFFDGTAALNSYFESPKVENVFIDNMATGYSIYSKGLAGGQGVMANAMIHGCKLMQIRAEQWGDSNTVRNCVFGTQGLDDVRNLGVYFYNVSGATSTRLLHNFFVSKNGMIQDDGSIKAIYDGNEFESLQTNSLGYMVHLKGGQYTIQNPTITNSRLSQLLSGQTYVPFQLDNVRAASISKNWISTPTSYSQIVISASAAYTLVDSDNESNVNGVPVAEPLVSDGGVNSVIRTPLRTIVPQASTLAAPATGHAAIWFDAADQRLHDVNSAGAFATTVGPSTAPAHQFANGVGSNGVVSYARPATSDLSDTAWATYTPTIAAQTGTITGATIVTSGRYKVIGKTVVCQFNVSVTNVGTGSPGAGMQVSAPTPATGAAGNAGSVFESAATGKSGACVILPSSSVFSTRCADGTSWFVNGYNLIGTITYEIA